MGVTRITGRPAVIVDNRTVSACKGQCTITTHERLGIVAFSIPLDAVTARDVLEAHGAGQDGVDCRPYLWVSMFAGLMSGLRFGCPELAERARTRYGIDVERTTIGDIVDGMGAGNGERPAR